MKYPSMCSGGLGNFSFSLFFFCSPDRYLLAIGSRSDSNGMLIVAGAGWMPSIDADCVFLHLVSQSDMALLNVRAGMFLQGS